MFLTTIPETSVELWSNAEVIRKINNASDSVNNYGQEKSKINTGINGIYLSDIESKKVAHKRPESHTLDIIQSYLLYFQQNCNEYPAHYHYKNYLLFQGKCHLSSFN